MWSPYFHICVIKYPAIFFRLTFYVNNIGFNSWHRQIKHWTITNVYHTHILYQNWKKDFTSRFRFSWLIPVYLNKLRFIFFEYWKVWIKHFQSFLQQKLSCFIFKTFIKFRLSRPKFKLTILMNNKISCDLHSPNPNLK